MAFELVVLSGPGRCGDTIQLVAGQSLVVGRELEADERFRSDRQMSSAHFSIEASGDGCQLVDLESTNGTYLNGHRITSEPIRAGDEIRAGNTIFELVGTRIANGAKNPMPFEGSSDKPVADDLQITTIDGDCRELFAGNRLTVGRTNRADWVFASDLRLSSQHFSVESTDGGWEVIDLSSTNGTYLNGRRIDRAWLNPNDEVRAGTTLFYFLFKTSVPYESSVSNVVVDVPIDRNERYMPIAEPPIRESFMPPIAPYPDRVSDDPRKEPRPTSDVDRPIETAWKGDLQPESFPEPLPTQFDEEPRIEPSTTTSDSEPTPGVDVREPLSVHVEDASVFEQIPYESFACGSGLVLFRGGSARFDPIDVARRLLLASPGWLVEKHELVEFKVTRLDPNDVTWMLPWSEQWGQHQSMIVYSRSEPKRIEKSFVQLQRLLDLNEQEKWFAPDSVADFLANRLHDTVHRFFSPLDAVLVEFSNGKRWAYFAPKDIEKILPKLSFRRRRTW